MLLCTYLDYVKRALRNCLWSRVYQLGRLMSIHLQIHFILPCTDYIDYHFVSRHSWNHSLGMAMRIPVPSSLFQSKYLIARANLERSKEQACDESLAGSILFFSSDCIQTNIPFPTNKNSSQGVAISSSLSAYIDFKFLVLLWLLYTAVYWPLKSPSDTIQNYSYALGLAPHYSRLFLESLVNSLN